MNDNPNEKMVKIMWKLCIIIEAVEAHHHRWQQTWNLQSIKMAALTFVYRRKINDTANNQCLHRSTVKLTISETKVNANQGFQSREVLFHYQVISSMEKVHALCVFPICRESGKFPISQEIDTKTGKKDKFSITECDRLNDLNSNFYLFLILIMHLVIYS